MEGWDDVEFVHLECLNDVDVKERQNEDVINEAKNVNDDVAKDIEMHLNDNPKDEDAIFVNQNAKDDAVANIVDVDLVFGDVEVEDILDVVVNDNVDEDDVLVVDDNAL